MKICCNLVRSLSAVVLLAVLSGCAGQQVRTKSSVVDYLYPEQSNGVVEPEIPVLKIPIRVGIAFVPEQPTRRSGMGLWGGYAAGPALTEGRKTELLEAVAEQFRGYDFVSAIEVIPSAYLTPGGSFENLQQIRTMYGVDVIALVSYDQVQFTDEGALSLTYWTLVGAYVVSGEKNDTSTMLDTAVYDIASRKMLFRAPGTSSVQGSSTPVNLSEELRKDSNAGFTTATEQMIVNLDQQLDAFRTRVKENPEEVRIVRRDNNASGGGTFDVWSVGLLAMLGLVGMRGRRARRF